MNRPVDYYFSIVSPWAYMGHAEFLKLAEQHQSPINFKPVALGKVFPESGGLPLGKRHPLRQAYRLIELQRWREKRNVPLVLKPKFFPFDPEAVDRVAIALAQSHPDVVGTFVALAFRAVWVEEQDLADDANIRAILTSLDLPVDYVLSASRADDVAAAYARNVADALKIGAFGSPCYVVEGEVFWGQDRLDMLGEMLSSGRAPFTAPT